MTMKPITIEDPGLLEALYQIKKEQKFASSEDVITHLYEKFLEEPPPPRVTKGLSGKYSVEVMGLIQSHANARGTDSLDAAAEGLITTGYSRLKALGKYNDKQNATKPTKEPKPKAVKTPKPKKIKTPKAPKEPKPKAKKASKKAAPKEATTEEVKNSTKARLAKIAESRTK